MRSTSLLLAVIVSGLVQSAAVQSAEYHVSDEVSVFMHTGPSNQYRIKSNVPSGTMLNLLEQNKDSGYSRVRLASGSEGWIQSKLLDKGQSLVLRLPDIEKQLVISRQTTSEQSEALIGLEQDLQKSSDHQAKLTTQAARLQNEVQRLKLEIDSMDETNMMGWFLRGGALALGGVLIGLILTLLPKRRRRNNDWF